jgi:hypothetical protein
MGIFDLLLAFDHLLVDWVLRASPITEEQRADMQRVLAFRGDLDESLNELVAYRLKLPLTVLPNDVQRLTDATKTLTDAAKTIDTVQGVLTAVGTAVEVAGNVAAYALAL